MVQYSGLELGFYGEWWGRGIQRIGVGGVITYFSLHMTGVLVSGIMLNQEINNLNNPTRKCYSSLLRRGSAEKRECRRKIPWKATAGASARNHAQYGCDPGESFCN